MPAAAEAPENSHGQPPDKTCPILPCAEGQTTIDALLTMVDQAHDKLSSRLEAAVRGVDNFFATENVFEETNNSYARIPMDITLDDGQFRFKVRVKGRLSLPHTQRRLKLLIEGDSTNSSILEEQLNQSATDAVADNDYFLSLETQLKKTGNWKIRPAVGIKLTWTPDLFGRLRAIRYFPVTRRWLGRFALTGTALVDAGPETDGNLQFSRALGKDFLFRSSSRIKWTHTKGYSEGTQVFALFQHLSKKANLAYQAGIFGDNEAKGWDITEYRTWLRYRRLVYNDWLFMDLVPEVRFLHGNDYHPSYLLTLRIEPVFGKAVPTDKLRQVD